MLNQYLSNRTEILIDRLVENLARHPPKDIFSSHHVIVPHAALKRKISLEIAQRTGICASIEFSFLSAWLWLHSQITEDAPAHPPLAPQVLQWRIFKLLDSIEDDSSRLKNYLDHSDALMKFELADRLSRLFIRYTRTQPQWLFAWAHNQTIDLLDLTDQTIKLQDQSWQADLWRKIIADSTADILLEDGVPLMHFIDTLKTHGTAPFSNIPDCLHIFVDHNIDRLQINALIALGEHIEINLYIFNPCQEYWQDIVEPKKYAQLLRDNRLDYQQVGNDLLASWGKPARILLKNLSDQPLVNENYYQTKASTLLEQIQNDILNLQPIRVNNENFKQDGSLQIHISHSLLREIEILHDRLLALFNEDESISPDTVVILTPQLDQAAPLIDAIFGRNKNTPYYLPYVISGQGNLQENPLSSALLALLELANSRINLSDVFNVLMIPEIAKTFNLTENFSGLQNTIKNNGIYWGFNGEYKKQFKLPEINRYTFDDGINRLMLSYAFDPNTIVPINNCIAGTPVGGTQMDQLAQFFHFIDLIRQLHDKISQSQTIASWREIWLWTMDQFLTVRREDAELEKSVVTRIDDLYTLMLQAYNGKDQTPIDSAVAKQSLQSILENAAFGSVPCGSIVFAQINDLRYLSYDHVFIIGLDSNIYPTNQHKDEFDLTSELPNSDDFGNRDWDKFIFLNVLLGARKNLYISYTGRDIRNNTEKSQSVVLSELLNALTSSITNEEQKKQFLDQLIIEHPLQSFSTRYFNGENDKLFSYRKDLCQALIQRFSNEPEESVIPLSFDNETDSEDLDYSSDCFQKPFITEHFQIDALKIDNPNITLAQLKAFFNNPSKYFLTNVLNIKYAYDEKPLENLEPISFSKYAPRSLIDRLLPLYLNNTPLEQIQNIAQACVEKPLGKIGNHLTNLLCEDLAQFVKQFKTNYDEPILESTSHTIEFDSCAFKLTGTLTDLRPCGLLLYRYGDIFNNQKLDAWITHLFLCANEQLPNIKKETLYYAKDQLLNFKELPVLQAKQQLKTLMDLYIQGFEKPIHFFNSASWEYVNKLQKNSNINENDSTDSKDDIDVTNKFLNIQNGDIKDPYVALISRGYSNIVLSSKFKQTAVDVLGLLEKHLQENDK